jgi:hypothetical protein
MLTFEHSLLLAPFHIILATLPCDLQTALAKVSQQEHKSLLLSRPVRAVDTRLRSHTKYFIRSKISYVMLDPASLQTTS